jgi:hypothetical protein
MHDPSLGAQGLTLAQQLLNVVAAPYQQMQSVFATAGAAVTVVVAPLVGLLKFSTFMLVYSFLNCYTMVKNVLSLVRVWQDVERAREFGPPLRKP